MHKRTFLISSLAAIGTGLFLPTWGKAHEGRRGVTLKWAFEQYKKGNIIRRWIPKRYVYKSEYDLEILKGLHPLPWKVNKVNPNYKIFIDMKDGKLYYYTTAKRLPPKDVKYRTFLANTVRRNFS